MDLLKEIIKGILLLLYSWLVVWACIAFVFWLGGLLLYSLLAIFSKDLEDIIGDVNSKYGIFKHWLACFATCIIAFTVFYLIYLAMR
jgi:hypothetical protein